MEDIFTPETSQTLTPSNQERSKRTGRVWAITLGSLLAVAVAATAVTLGVVYGTKKSANGGGQKKPSYNAQMVCDGTNAYFMLRACGFGSGSRSSNAPPLLTYGCAGGTSNYVYSNPNYRNGLYLFLFEEASGSYGVTMTGRYYDSGDPGDVSSFVENFVGDALNASFFAIVTDGDASPFLTNIDIVTFLDTAGSVLLTSTTSYAAGSAYCLLFRRNPQSENLATKPESATAAIALSAPVSLALNDQ